jgi:hypothetical protein
MLGPSQSVHVSSSHFLEPLDGDRKHCEPAQGTLLKTVRTCSCATPFGFGASGNVEYVVLNGVSRSRLVKSQ